MVSRWEVATDSILACAVTLFCRVAMAVSLSCVSSSLRTLLRRADSLLDFRLHVPHPWCAKISPVR